MNNTSLVIGSLGALAKQSGASLAETFLAADVIVLCDTSGSMSSRDSRGGQSRYDVACQELASLQTSLPGKLAIISFSSGTMFCPDGKPFNLGGGTDMAGALDFARVADIEGMRFILISDGQPDEEGRTLAAAAKYKSRIDTIFVGPEDDMGGRSFLNRLAAASGGQAITADRAKELASSVERLLLRG
jgi:Mg-chelatase subunit ChlD